VKYRCSARDEELARNANLRFDQLARKKGRLPTAKESR
jgi:hypothetical protein